MQISKNKGEKKKEKKQELYSTNPANMYNNWITRQVSLQDQQSLTGSIYQVQNLEQLYFSTISSRIKNKKKLRKARYFTHLGGPSEPSLPVPSCTTRSCSCSNCICRSPSPPLHSPPCQGFTSAPDSSHPSLILAIST